MDNSNQNNGTDRRQFIGTLTAGAATLGLSTLFAPLQELNAENVSTTYSGEDPEQWIKKIKGKHRIVFDVPQPNEIFPFAWPRVFLLTNEKTGSQAKDCGVMVVLRHSAIGYAMQNEVWAKYNLGEFFHANDPANGKPATRNPFWKPAKGDFKVPGIGEVAIGINELQESGVMFCVCDAALSVYSAALAGAKNLNAEEVKKDWVAALIPGVQVVPSGVWAIGRAQENGCGYCYAG